MTENRRGYAPVYRGEVYYETAGRGRSILLIHAGVVDCSMWQAQFEKFANHYQVIRYAARGFGKSRTETTSFSNRQDIQDLLDHLGIEEVAVIGIARWSDRDRLHHRTSRASLGFDPNSGRNQWLSAPTQ